MSFFDFPVYEVPSHSITDVLTVEGPHIYIQSSQYGEPEQGLLKKIMGAAKFDLSALPITLLGDNDTADVLNRGIKADQLIIAFGVPTQRLSLNCDTRPYDIINISGKSILFSHNLTTLIGNAQMKKALWGALRNFYNL